MKKYIFFCLISIFAVISCSIEDLETTMEQQTNCDDEGLELPIDHIEYFEVDENLSFEELDLCDVNRPVIAIAKNVTGSLHQDIFGDFWIRTFTEPEGSFGDSHFNSMICCGLPDHYEDSLSLQITYSGIFRSQKGLNSTTDLKIINGDTLALAIGGQSFNIVKILEIME